MNVRKAHKIWIEQCEAAQTIKARFGLTAAFDYVVGEKLMRLCQCCLETSRLRARTAAVCVRGETHVHAGRDWAHSWRKLSVRKTKGTLMFWRRRMILFVRVRLQLAERVRQFMLVKELLTAPMLGTS